MFGNGDEETKANFDERSAADPKGPIYGGYIGPTEPQPMIYMLHNKTSQPLIVYIMLDVTFIHGTPGAAQRARRRGPTTTSLGILFGRTFDVPRNPKSKDGTFETAEDDPRGVIEWTSTVDGTMIGTGSHLHPGGLRVITRELRLRGDALPRRRAAATAAPCCSNSDVIWHNGVSFSEDYQTEVTNPAWRAPIHEGDRIRISGIYENKKHAWYEAMTHEGIYIDQAQPPKGRCKPYLVGPAAKRKGKQKVDVTAGVRNRAWSHHPTDQVCGKRYGAPPCERPLAEQPPGTADRHGDDRQLPLPARRPVALRRPTAAACGAAGHARCASSTSTRRSTSATR